jgi:hypothetical protein
MTKGKDESKVEVIEEIDAAEFDKLSETGGGSVDYEAVWTLVKDRFLTTKGLDAAVNKVRKLSGSADREFYWSERKRVFTLWRNKGRTVNEKLGRVGNKKTKVYQFLE